LGKD
jgi:hypothetical protein